jgi:hypothetical protein
MSPTSYQTAPPRVVKPQSTTPSRGSVQHNDCLQAVRQLASADAAADPGLVVVVVVVLATGPPVRA